MSITGTLSDFSLPEIVQFVDKGHKTGLLTLQALPESSTKLPSNYYIWINQGNFVAAANHLNQQSLVQLLEQYPWVSNRVVTKLAQFCPPNKPLGLYLRNQGVLQVEQLEHLFQIQVAQQLCALFQLKDALFTFEQNTLMPAPEMTGLTMPIGLLEVILQKLNWLQKLFDARKWQQTQSGSCSYSESFCTQLIKILDIAFFHSLNFSLFDTNNTVEKLSQFLDLCDRPYDLPKSRLKQIMPCIN